MGRLQFAKYKVTLQCAAVGYSLVEQIIQGLLFRELSLWLSPGGARIHAPGAGAGAGRNSGKTNTRICRLNLETRSSVMDTRREICPWGVGRRLDIAIIY